MCLSGRFGEKNRLKQAVKFLVKKFGLTQVFDSKLKFFWIQLHQTSKVYATVLSPEYAITFSGLAE